MKVDSLKTRKKQRGRLRAEKRFRAYGILALGFAALFILFFFIDIFGKGLPAFRTVQVQATIEYSQAVADGSYRKAVSKEMRHMVSRGWLRDLVAELRKHPEKIGSSETLWVPAEFRVNQYIKGKKGHGLKAKYQKVADRLQSEGKIRMAFNWQFFLHGDSKLPEMAGIGAALVGSVMVMLITMVLAVPLGVLTAVYLEEFAPDNGLTRLIEININNLAAIPSILYGLLGLAIFINIFGVPRSSALAGGMTLSLMTLPTIIISTRAALRSVPNSIREAAFGVGASRLQTVWHHVLPPAMPGILTGSIIGLAQALGETAPLLIVGMMAFIPESPTTITSAATVLPAQVYTWSADSIRAFGELTAAGVIVLLSVMLMLNGLAIWLRHRLDKTW
ncbi:MAG: phosphate ABC transporter permease PstA [Gammaproteobacteria bacterium]|nr:MAG: phosphate ABC transporter permease PstA [Gammaproteobacteria bacterium]